MKKIGLVLGLLFAPVVLLCAENEDSVSVENAKMFADLYGIARWFVPSDEAQSVDWDKFAIAGLYEVSRCRTDKELHGAMNRLFSPIIPMFCINKREYGSSELKRYYKKNANKGLDTVRWQHSGGELSYISNYYTSKRINRPYASKNLGKFAFFGYFPASGYADTVKIKVTAKANGVGLPNVYLHLDSYDDVEGYLKSLYDNEIRPEAVSGEKFVSLEKSFPVHDVKSYTDILWGVYIEGNGKLLIKDISVEDSNGNCGLKMDFSDKNVFRNSFYLFNHSNYCYDVENGSLSIECKDYVFRNDEARSVVNLEISEGVYAHVPVMLYGDRDRTYPATDTCGYFEWIDDLYAEGVKNKAVAELADISVMWNAVRYFSPYLAEQKIDWDSEFLSAARKVNAGISGEAALRQMMAALNDAHVGYQKNEVISEVNVFPACLAVIGDTVVIKESYDSGLKPGDMLMSVNGENVSDKIKYLFSLESCRDAVKASRLAVFDPYRVENGDTVAMCKVKRNGTESDIVVRTISENKYFENYYIKFYTDKKYSSRWLSDNVCYINTLNTSLADVADLLKDRKSDDYVIFDIRNGSYWLIRYLIGYITDNQEFSYAQEPYVPEIAYPEMIVAPASSVTGIAGHAVDKHNIFLINAGVISNQETFLDLLRYNGLCYLIGESTAGITGRANGVELPSGLTVYFTGERFYSCGGKEGDFFKKGIEPDLRVSFALEDYLTGRDPQIEAAIDIANEIITNL